MTALSEASEQIFVADMLRAAKIPFFAVPNGGTRNLREAQNMKRQGVMKGVLDLLIVQKPPLAPWLHGTALEMKRGRWSPKRRKS